MPALQVPPAGPLDRFVPAIHRVETANYAELLREWSNMFSQRLSQSTFLTIKYGLINVEQELNNVSELQRGWDSYGAEPPTAEAIAASRTILRELAGALICPSAIVPSAEGGVSIYFIKDNRTVYIENYNDGAQALVTYDRSGHTDVFEIGTDIPSADVGNRISRYLDRT